MSDNTEAVQPKRNKIRFNPLLPYWAVFQADLRLTLHSWLYRVWVFLSVLVTVGYLLYRFGAYREAGMIQNASELMTDLVRWLVVGSVTLIIVLTAGCISSERGTIADTVLSRGISRLQYFMGKWHARLVSVLGTFFILGALILLASILLLRDERLSPTGSLIALTNVAALLVVVISCSVAVSAIANNTLLGVAIVWVLLYGVGFALSFLPASIPSPDRALHHLPNILHGMYDLQSTVHLLGWSLAVSCLVGVVGMAYFSQRDI